MKRILAAVVLGGCALFAGSAHATQLNATFAGTVNGDVTIPVGENLNNASSITFVDEEFFVSNNPGATYLGNPNQFVGELSQFNIGNILSIPSIDSFSTINGFMTWTGASNAQYFFNLETLVRNPSSPGVMDLFGTGTFGTTVAGGVAPFDNVTASTAAWRMSVNEVGGGSLSASFSWGTPAFDNPVTEVPEPATLALLGTGLLGLVFLIRRSRRVADNGENRGAAA